MSLAEVDVEELPSLNWLTSRYRYYLEVRATPQRAIKEKLAEVERVHAAYVARLEGEETVRTIAERHDVPFYTVRGYKPGRFPQLIRTIIRTPVYNKKIPDREEDVDLAFIVGILFSQKYKKDLHEGKEAVYTIVETDDEKTEKITSALDRLGIDYSTKGKKEISLKHGRSTKYLADFVAEQRIPWELLVTREERRSFLAGYLERRGYLHISKRTTPTIRLNTLNEEMVCGLTFLLSEADIYVRFSVKQSDIDVGSKQDIIKVREIVRSYSRKRELSELIDACPKVAVDLDIKTCLKFYEYKRQYPKKGSKEIYRRLGIDIEPSKSTTSAITTRAKRCLAVEELRVERPDYNVIGYCYRELGLSSRAARALAGVYSMDEIEEYDPDTIIHWTQIYDEDNSVEVDLERSTMQIVETKCKELAIAVSQGETCARKARESIMSLAKASGVPFDRIDNLYWSTYLQELNGSRGKE